MIAKIKMIQEVKWEDVEVSKSKTGMYHSNVKGTTIGRSVLNAHLAIKSYLPTSVYSYKFESKNRADEFTKKKVFNFMILHLSKPLLRLL